MQHALISGTICTWFVSVDSRNYKNLILDLLCNSCQSAEIIKYGILIICGARTDDRNKLIRLTGKYLLDLSISF